MKRLLIICFCILPSFLFAQMSDEPYDFPIKPGTEQWSKLTSSDQMDEVCVIPDNILNNLSTKALFLTCLNYPRVLDFLLVDDMQSGFNFYSKHFNGLGELMKRSDLDQILTQEYMNLDLSQSKLSSEDLKLNFPQVVFFELLISQETNINNLRKEDKVKLLGEAIKKLEQRQSLGESFYRQRTSALILSRILSSENKLTPYFDQNGNDIMKIFNTSVFLADSKLIDRLLIAAKSML
jgi:hypothetical protein